MNILFVYSTLLIPSRGGTERVTCSVAEALGQKGHHIYYMATYAGNEDKELIDNPKYFLIDKKLDTETKKDIIINICQQHEIDTIINEWGEFDDFSIFSKEVMPSIKIITCLHFDVTGYTKMRHRIIPKHPFKKFIAKMLYAIGFNPYSHRHHLSYLRRYQKMLSVSDAVVTVSPIIATQLKRLTRRHPKKIHSILNPLTINTHRPIYNLNKKEKTLLYVGRFTKEKNVDIILKAWALIAPLFPEWKLELAGAGELYDECIALSKQLHIPRVHFHGHVTNVVTLYERAEYLILASSHESFSCVVLESMAYGCHPIVFDYPSAKIVIPSHHIGTRIKRHSIKSLAHAISEAILTKRSNENHMEEVTTHLNQFNMDKLVNEWEFLLEQVSTSKSHA